MDKLRLVWLWLVRSSVNPEQTSLTVRMFLLGLIPATMKVVLFACTFGVVCLPTSADELTEVVNMFALIVFWVLSTWAGFGFVYAFFRKVGSSLKGTNAVLNVLKS